MKASKPILVQECLPKIITIGQCLTKLSPAVDRLFFVPRV